MREQMNQTHRSKYLRDLARDGCDVILSRADAFATAEEIERYYGGMLAWKATAGAKDATLCAAAFAAPVDFSAIAGDDPMKGDRNKEAAYARLREAYCRQ